MSSPAINPNKALWEKGDFTRIASTMRESGEAVELAETARLCRPTLRKGLPFRELVKDISRLRLAPQA